MQSSQTYWTKGKKPREEDWIPFRKPPSYYQELEARKAADLRVSVDPEVLAITNTEELPINSGTFRGHFPAYLSKNAEKCGFTRLRKVQNAALTYIDAGYTVHLATTARSGKTVAYMLPMIQKVHEDLELTKHVDRHPRAIITTYCMEETKNVYETLLGLVGGLDINVAIYVGQLDHGSIAKKDRADILVTTIKWVHKLANEQNCMSLEYLKMFVIDSIDEQVAYRNLDDKDVTRRVFSLYDRDAKNSQLVLVSSDVSALDCEFWNERSQIAEKWVVLKYEQRLSPSNHLLARIKEKATPHAVFQAIKNFDEGQVIVVVQAALQDFMIRCEQIQEHLEKRGISAVFFHTKLSMNEKDAILNDFITFKKRVLIMKYSYPVRVIRVPNIKQVIHVSIPSFFEEEARSSYQYSSGAISFVPNARSVLLLNVDAQKDVSSRKIGRIVDAIQECSSSVEWPHNNIPSWLAKYHGKGALYNWDEEDKEGLEDYPDLQDRRQVKRDESFGTKGPRNYPQPKTDTTWTDRDSRGSQQYDDSFSYYEEQQDQYSQNKVATSDSRRTGSENYYKEPEPRNNEQGKYYDERGISGFQGPPQYYERRPYQQKQFQNSYPDDRYEKSPQNCCEPRQPYQGMNNQNQTQQYNYNPNQGGRYEDQVQPLCQNMQRMQMSEGPSYQRDRDGVQSGNYYGSSQGDYQQPMREYPQGGCLQCTCSSMNQNPQYGQLAFQQDFSPRPMDQPFQNQQGGSQSSNSYQQPVRQNPSRDFEHGCQTNRTSQNEQEYSQQSNYKQQPMTYQNQGVGQQSYIPDPKYQTSQYVAECSECIRSGSTMGQNAQYNRGGTQQDRMIQGQQVQNSPRNTNSVPNIVPGNRFAHRRKPEESQKETFENRTVNRPASGNRQEGNQGNFNRW